MDIQCPRCGAKSVQAEGVASFPCPSCGAGLEVVESGAGFNIVGVQKDGIAGQRPGKPPKTEERTDPILSRYTGWQEGAIFLITLGIACGFIIFIDLKSLYLTYGYYFWKNPQNLTVLYVVAPVMLACFFGGIWIFRFAAKRKKGYREADSKQQERRET